MNYYFITGSSKGLGKSLLDLLLKDESNFAYGFSRTCSLKHERYQHTNVDLSDLSEVQNISFPTLKNPKSIVLINNAGISMRALFENTDIKVIKKLMDVNFWGAVFCTKFALPHILKQKGSIVAVSSIAGIKGLPARSGYSASKFALDGFMESLRVENLKNGLHVLIAYAGFTSSNIRNTSLSGVGTQQGESPRDEDKMMTPDQVAVHIYNAVSKKKNKIVLTLQGKMLTVINKFFPDKLDKMIYNDLAKEHDSPFH
jgi:short-subunit dehydrogenase